MATGIGVAVALFRSRNYLADFDAIYAQLGSTIRMVSVASANLTPEFVSRLEELGIVLTISSGGPEDSALVNGNDTGLWRTVLDCGFSASIDQPDLVLKLLGK
ncbi:hypothetical protein [Silicimonas sp. MF1-12-2]|uniref:hypothetical protein n=1 Tax=Silicimonas sp. MF1-12-2 TaxID=3384793 RepID=UPI0039B556B0